MIWDATARTGGWRAYEVRTYRQQASELCFQMDTMARTMIAFLDKSPYGANVSRDVIVRAVEVLSDEVMNNVPLYVCPNNPHEPGCAACGGKRWISMNEDEATARDLVPILPESC